MEGPCEYCRSPGKKVAGPEDGLKEDCFVCAACLKILRSPSGLSLVRGHVSLELRGVVEEKEASRLVDGLISAMAGARPSN